MVICLELGADLHMAQLIPLPLTVSCFSKIQIVFTFLVPAHPSSPGLRADKRVCVCVCLCLMGGRRRAMRGTRVCRSSGAGANIARCTRFRSSFRFTPPTPRQARFLSSHPARCHRRYKKPRSVTTSTRSTQPGILPRPLNEYQLCWG